jgi:N-acyl-D-aspartate/D-glutamate deacylase
MSLADEGGASFGLANFGQYVLSECRSTQNKRFEGLTVADAAAELGVSAFDALCEISVADDLGTGFSFPPNGDTPADWAARLDVWRDERAVLGASDAGAHLDFLATFNFPTVMLRRAVLDLELLSWEEAMQLLADGPARLYGLDGRGRLEVGAYADAVIIDPERLEADAITSRADLPGGSWRLYGGSSGVDHVFVNGTEIVSDGALTHERPGTVLRSGRDTSTVRAR